MTLTARAGRVALVLALLLPVLAAAAVFQAKPSAAATRLATVSVTSLDPIVARPGDTLHAAGTVRNVSRQTLRGLEVRMRLSRTPVGSRAELAAVAAGTSSSRDGDVIADERPEPRDLAPASQASFDLSVDLSDIGEAGLDASDQFGVYVMSVEVLASHRDGFGRVAIQRTYLPWVPDQPGLKGTGFTWLWPLVEQPTRLSDGTFANDAAAGAMAPGGRLDHLVSAGERLANQAPVVWAVDPDLLETAADMSDSNGYRVQTPQGTSVPGGGSGLASVWLDQVRAATASSAVLSLPYADADLVALHRAGITRDVSGSRNVGAAVAAELLQRPVRSDVVWPVDGFATRALLSTLRGSGAQAAFLDSSARPPSIELNYTPGARSSVATEHGRMPVLLTDPGLTGLLRHKTSSPLLDAQRFVAETAMITAELPSSGTDRDIVIAPPRYWSPDPVLLNRIIEGTADAEWMAPQTLDQLIASPPAEVDRKSLRYPESAREAELSKPYLTAIRFLHTDTATFAAILSRPDEMIPQLDRGAFRLESSWWRGRESRVNRLASERQYLTDQRSKVRVLPGSYTLGSSRGTIPLTIVNELDQDVTVGVRLRPTTQRLEVDPVAPLPIAAQSKEQVEVPVSAVATGLVTVEARLMTPGGAPYAPTVTMRVRVTQIGTVALIITIAAAGVLFLAAGIRVLRRTLSSRRRKPTPPPSEPTDGATSDEPHGEGTGERPRAAEAPSEAGTASRE